MAYRLIVTDLMNDTLPPSKTMYGPTPNIGDIIEVGLGRAKVTEIIFSEEEDEVFVQLM